MSQNVITTLNDNVLTVQIVNTDTGLATHRMNLWFYGSSNSVGGWGSSETVAPSAPVRYEYDAAGNRTLTEDELGTMTYNYDALSRMTGETRHITALNQSFAIGYTYELSGQLKTMTNPFNATVSYNYDKTSRLTEVSGTNYGISTPFVEQIKYRAWGAIKKADYGYGGHLDMSYDTRQRPTQYKMTGTAFGTPYTRGTDYKYYADGQLKAADDLANDVFDKSYKYDQAGRLKEALSGFEARGESLPPNTFPNRPYRQSYIYDVWNHRTGGEQKFWRLDLSYQVQSVYQNNRSLKFSYDADGRELINSYNAAGRSVEHISDENVGGYPTTNPIQPAFEISQVYDGDGAILKRTEIRRQDVTNNGQTTVETTTTTNYQIRSAVLGGQIIAVVGTDGSKTDGYVYAAGALLAKQTNLCQSCPVSVQWQEANPLTGSRSEVGANGGSELQERDPLGANTGAEDPWLYYEEPQYLDLLQSEQPLYLESGNNPFNPGECSVDGVVWDCNSLRNGNSAAQCPNNDCGGQVYFNSRGQRVISSSFQAYSDGTSGYNVPVWGNLGVRVVADGDNSSAPLDPRNDTIIDWENIQVASSSSSLNPSRQNQLSLNTNNNVSLQYDCLTLEDLINSQEFNYSAKGAWDKSFEGGFKREEGVSFFYSPSLRGFGWVGRIRNSRSVFMPSDPERANRVAAANNATWVVDLHTHPWRDGEKIPDVGTVSVSSIPSPADADGNGDFAVVKSTGKLGIILYPDFSKRGFGITTYADFGIIRESNRKNYILGCSWSKKR